MLEEFYVWLDTVPPSSKGNLDKAIRLALNEKKYLTRFLEDGTIPHTNNRAESAIRPFVESGLSLSEEKTVCSL